MDDFALVVLVGGPMHGIRTLLPRPEERMTLESRMGESVDYVCRLRRKTVVEGRSTPMALYAPESINDMEFGVLADDAMREQYTRH